MSYAKFQELFAELNTFTEDAMANQVNLDDFEFEESGELLQDRVDDTLEDDELNEPDNLLDDTTDTNKEQFRKAEEGLRNLASDAIALADKIKESR